MKTVHAVLVALTLPIGLAAQQPSGAPPANPVTAAFRGRITGLHRNLAQAFDSIPEAKFSYKPTPAQQTIGYIAQHLVNDNYLFCNDFGAMKANARGEGHHDGRLRQGNVAEGYAGREAQGVVHVLRGRLRAARRYEVWRSGHRDVRWPIAATGAREHAGWPCDRPGGSLQPDRELHAAQQHVAADGAPAAAPSRQLAPTA